MIETIAFAVARTVPRPEARRRLLHRAHRTAPRPRWHAVAATAEAVVAPSDARAGAVLRTSVMTGAAER
jgi:hypothetical protein